MERKIPLDKIDHTKQKMHEVLGIPLEEWKNFYQEMNNNHPLRIHMEAESLGFSKEEILETWSNSRCTSEVIAKLWKKRGRKEISLKEFFLTARLVNSSKESMRGPKISGIEGIVEGIIGEMLTAEITKRVEKSGSQVLIGTSHCDRWRKEHGDSQGCPSQIGCEKVSLIVHTVSVKDRYQPKSFKDFLDMERWINETIDEILEAKSLKELKKIFIP